MLGFQMTGLTVVSINAMNDAPSQAGLAGCWWIAVLHLHTACRTSSAAVAGCRCCFMQAWCQCHTSCLWPQAYAPVP